MKKKICIIILSIVIVCSLLSGCGDKHTAIIMKNAKDFTLTQEISESFKQENYGIQSYAFLKYIQENLPGRIAGTEKVMHNKILPKWPLIRKRKAIAMSC